MPAHNARSIRDIQQRERREASLAQAEPIEEDNQPLLYRLATGKSIDALNLATRNVKGRGLKRILDVFVLPLGYPHQLELARQASPQAEPQDVESIAEHLTHRRFEALHEPVHAEVLGVELFHNTVGVKVDYADAVAEQRALGRAVRRLLDLPQDRNIQLGRDVMYVPVATGKASFAQISQIESSLPPDLTFSPANPPLPGSSRSR